MVKQQYELICETVLTGNNGRRVQNYAIDIKLYTPIKDINFQNNRNNGTMCITFKVTKKGTRTASSKIFRVSDLKVFNADFDVFVCWTLLLLSFRRKIPSLWKNAGVYWRLFNLKIIILKRKGNQKLNWK